jgi:hypothetical protein
MLHEARHGMLRLMRQAIEALLRTDARYICVPHCDVNGLPSVSGLPYSANDDDAAWLASSEHGTREPVQLPLHRAIVLPNATSGECVVLCEV